MSLGNYRLARADPRLGAWLLLGAALAVACLLAPARAEAQPAGLLTARPLAGPVGTVFHFHGTGFAPNETVSTAVRWPDGSEEGDVLFQANGLGLVDFIWDSVGAVPGRYAVTAAGQESGRLVMA